MPTQINGSTGVSQVQDGVVSKLDLLKFTSSQQTITAGSTLTLAHGLGYEPMHVQVKLVCQIAEANYSIGDVIYAQASVSNSATDNKNCCIRVDATNVYVLFGSNATTFVTLNKTTYVGVDLTNANWKIIVEAF